MGLPTIVALSIAAYGSGSQISSLTIFVLIGLLVIGLFVAQQYNTRRNNDALVKFAAANNLNYLFNSGRPIYPGIIFNGEGHSHKLTHAFGIPTSTTSVELGNFVYTTGSGKSATTHDYGYVRFKLPRRLPHMLLDATANNFMMFSNLRNSINKDQRLQLEGDFNKYFTLYVPKQYERDALYIFTPDVMEALVMHARNFDVEIVDDELYLYYERPFKFNDQKTWEKLLYIVSQISPEFDAQSDYYADERVGSRVANVISNDGRRLKPGFSWLAIIIVAFIVGSNIFGALGFELADNWIPGIIIVSILIAALRWTESAAGKKFYRL